MSGGGDLESKDGESTRLTHLPQQCIDTSHGPHPRDSFIMDLETAARSQLTPAPGPAPGVVPSSSTAPELADSTSDTPAGGGPCVPAPPLMRRKDLLTPEIVTPACATT